MKKNPVSIPHTVWHADDIRRGEREAADALGLTLYELMLRAGEAAFQCVVRRILTPAIGWCCAVMVITAAMATWSRGWLAVGIEVTLLAQRATNRCRKRPRWHAKHG